LVSEGMLRGSHVGLGGWVGFDWLGGFVVGKAGGGAYR
jgi:hypothetical protein